MRRRFSGTGCGACGRASQARAPGGLGSPSAPTTWGCPSRAGRGRTSAAKAACWGGRRVRRPSCGSTVPKPKIAAVERREARRSASWTGVPDASGTGPAARRNHGCGVPHQRLSALRPLGFEGEMKAHPAPSKEQGRRSVGFLDAAHQDEDEQDDDDQTEPAAAVVARAVERPAADPANPPEQGDDENQSAMIRADTHVSILQCHRQPGWNSSCSLFLRAQLGHFSLRDAGMIAKRPFADHLRQR